MRNCNRLVLFYDSLVGELAIVGNKLRSLRAELHLGARHYWPVVFTIHSQYID